MGSGCVRHGILRDRKSQTKWGSTRYEANGLAFWHTGIKLEPKIKCPRRYVRLPLLMHLPIIKRQKCFSSPAIAYVASRRQRGESIYLYNSERGKSQIESTFHEMTPTNKFVCSKNLNYAFAFGIHACTHAHKHLLSRMVLVSLDSPFR